MSRTQRKVDHALAVAGCGIALAGLVPVAAYQLGVVGSLPDPPARIFDSETLTESKEAHPLGVPDSLLGLASYGVTLALLMAARGRGPIATTLLGMKLSADASLAITNTVRGVVKHRKLCSWCLGTAAGTAVMVVCGRRFLRE